jgi:hypothetical protein
VEGRGISVVAANFVGGPTNGCGMRTHDILSAFGELEKDMDYDEIMYRLNCRYTNGTGQTKSCL